ncbi:MAG: 50S ribosomal protein L21e [archaeon GB-1867-097]|nr:50S ribosomal protein L21e [Candidatus Culexmicrobium thermophilum]MCS7384361.1 50S ribosomal protein L21e [Candidatus Culexmicrobium thermophilum]
MVKRSKGYRSKTRKLLRKKPRERGLYSLSRILYEYRKGEKVSIIIDPSVHKGMPHKRYHGKIGIILGRRGRAYIIETYLGEKKKTLIVPPQHLRPFTATD